MEAKIIEEKTNRLVFEMENADHSVCTALKEELWLNSDVKNAGYSVSHPYVGHPKFIVETKKGSDPRKAISAALKKLVKHMDDLEPKAKKL